MAEPPEAARQVAEHQPARGSRRPTPIQNRKREQVRAEELRAVDHAADGEQQHEAEADDERSPSAAGSQDRRAHGVIGWCSGAAAAAAEAAVELGALVGRERRRRSVLAELERADVGRRSPSGPRRGICAA